MICRGTDPTSRYAIEMARTSLGNRPPVDCMSGDYWWDAARQRALTELWYRYLTDEQIPGGSGEAFERLCNRIMSADWLADRPLRRLPPLWVIARYWADRGDVFNVRIGQPHCFACHQPASARTDNMISLRNAWNGAKGHLERAHLVNRAWNGLDGAQNLVPLCIPCHEAMPYFRGYDEDPGPIQWVQAGGPAAYPSPPKPGWRRNPRPVTA